MNATTRKRKLTSYRKMLAQQTELAGKIRRARESLADGCDHPSQHVRQLSEDRDNGYGRWWKHEYRFCSICRSENHYGTWTRPENLSRD